MKQGRTDVLGEIDAAMRADAPAAARSLDEVRTRVHGALAERTRRRTVRRAAALGFAAGAVFVAGAGAAYEAVRVYYLRVEDSEGNTQRLPMPVDAQGRARMEFQGGGGAPATITVDPENVDPSGDVQGIEWVTQPPPADADATGEEEAKLEEEGKPETPDEPAIPPK